MKVEDKNIKRVLWTLRVVGRSGPVSRDTPAPEKSNIP